jgi:hypothetical protein
MKFFCIEHGTEYNISGLADQKDLLKNSNRNLDFALEKIKGGTFSISNIGIGKVYSAKLKLENDKTVKKFLRRQRRRLFLCLPTFIQAFYMHSLWSAIVYMQ